MEALTGATVAALTVYDMCKALSHAIVIGPAKLLGKRGGSTTSETALMSRMAVTVLYFASLRDAAGVASETVEAGADLRALYDALRARHGFALPQRAPARGGRRRVRALGRRRCATAARSPSFRR